MKRSASELGLRQCDALAYQEMVIVALIEGNTLQHQGNHQKREELKQKQQYLSSNEDSYGEAKDNGNTLPALKSTIKEVCRNRRWCIQNTSRCGEYF